MAFFNSKPYTPVIQRHLPHALNLIKAYPDRDGVTFSNTASLTNGLYGKQFSCPGATTDHITVPQPNPALGQGSFSVYVFLISRDPTGVGIIARDRGAGAFGTKAGFELEVLSGVVHNSGVDDGAGNAAILPNGNSNHVLTKDRPTIYLLSWDAPTGKAEVFVKEPTTGFFVSAVSATNASVGAFTSPNSVGFGGFTGNPGNGALNCDILDIRFYSRSFTQDRAKQFLGQDNPWELYTSEIDLPWAAFISLTTPGSGNGKGGSSGKGGGRGSGKGGPGKKKTNQGRASNSAWSLIRITNV